MATKRFHPDPDTIADCVLKAFNVLPPKFKPRRLANGVREWVTLAGVVLSTSTPIAGINGATASQPTPLDPRVNDHAATIEQSKREGYLKCVALATGIKSLPQAKVEMAQGRVLHDSHAEILAIRSFNRFLVDECSELAERGLGSTSQWIRWRELGTESQEGNGPREDTQTARDGQPLFELKEGVNIHFYSSECPCGDASMELTMAEQEDATPWASTPPAKEAMLGRGHFDKLGVVRRKPARADAPVVLSKTCSDKLALKQVTGLLSGIVGRLIWPGNVFISTLVLPQDRIVNTAVERCWGSAGRMEPILHAEQEIKDSWERAGFGFRPFEVKGTERKFEYGRLASATTAIDGDADGKTVPSNLSAVWTPRRSEVLINGVLQGRKQFDPKGASCVSRRALWEAIVEVAKDSQGITGLGRDGENLDWLAKEWRKETYGEAKRWRVREEVKKAVCDMALKGWRRGEGDDGWKLDT